MTAQDLAAILARAMTDQTPWSVPTFEGFLRYPGSILAAEASGFALGRVSADEAELLTLAVLPEARRQGIARRCLSEFEQEVREGKARRIFLEVAEDNYPARQLYQGAGYLDVGHRPAYYRAPDGRRRDAVLMEKTLSGA